MSLTTSNAASADNSLITVSNNDVLLSLNVLLPTSILVSSTCCPSTVISSPNLLPIKAFPFLEVILSLDSTPWSFLKVISPAAVAITSGFLLVK